MGLASINDCIVSCDYLAGWGPPKYLGSLKEKRRSLVVRVPSQTLMSLDSDRQARPGAPVLSRCCIDLDFVIWSV